ncbi:Protein CBG09778 [Caenorhabditis briggsae]|uniref:Protein CBG09778 n=1 Tax=Caenorhabditis briggsae TaxID=6238 RepID=A8X9L8_CAEBR|nr:Protein CBG09778 [Caenorhabditis briggsae]CAP29333.2 Protein CBG09778 [Caenorhabditis briggsae]
MSSEGGTAVIQRYFGGGDSEQRTALQFAFYNVLLFVLLGVALCGLFALYNMMYMFLSPMLWAVLVGTVLFPFKKKVTDIVQNLLLDWLRHLQDTNQTLAKAVITLPFTGFKKVSDTIYKTFASPNGAIIALAYAALKVLSYERTFMYVISWIGRLYGYLDSFIVFFARPWVLPLIVVYFCCYAAWIYVQDPKQINKKLARSFSLPIWIYVISYASLYFGPLRACVFGVSAAVLGLLSAGVIGSQRSSEAEEKPKEETSSVNQDESSSLLPPNVEKILESAKEKLDATEKSLLENSMLSTSTVDEAITGDWLIRCVFGLCALLWVVRHDGALILIAIPFVLAVLSRVAEQLGITAAVNNFLDNSWQKIAPSVMKVVEITVAGPLRQFVKMLFSSDKYIVESLYDKMDVLSSVIVMALLAFSAILAVFFVGFQLHGETVHLVRLTSNVVNSRPDWLAAAMDYTEDQLEENNIDIDDYVQQAYEQGRTWLASNVRSLANAKDTKRADMLEEQVKQVVDKLYHLWEDRNNNMTVAVNQTSRGDVWQQLKGVTDLAALKDELTLIVKENLDTLMGVAQSVGSILAVNVSIFSSLLVSFAGIILSFGMELLNTFIELIVFLTMVYYLLSASRTRWLPLQWASDLSAVTANDETINRTRHFVSFRSYPFTFIFFSSGVFILSAKMAVFYGLYTYFVHSLFDLNIVFVPSMAATLFAAIPIMPPYIVAIFGIVELWLVRGEGAAALVFTLASFAPVMFADATFYKEVKGSHPYVTGLAIIGGMYWLGLQVYYARKSKKATLNFQGAIIGPIILCLCLVLVNVYLQHVKPSALYTPAPTPRNIKLSST